MLGYKTLAEGVIQMDQVLQREMMDFELDLYSNYKDKTSCSTPIAKVFLVQVSSTPVDHDAKNSIYLAERNVMDYTDVEDDGDSSSAADEDADLFDADALPTKRNPRVFIFRFFFSHF